MEEDSTASAVVIGQRLRPLGYSGCDSILRAYVHQARAAVIAPRRAFVRMEPQAGERFEVDWRHFGALEYQGDTLHAKEQKYRFDRTTARPND